MDEKKIKRQKIPAGFAACYGTEGALLKAARQAKEKGYTSIEAYSPFPVEGISEVLGHKEKHLPWMVFAGGVFGAVSGFMMQYVSSVWHLPLNIGGRPLNSWPAFIPITFEFTILFAAAAGFVGFVSRCRLPEIYHPVFDIPGFERATADRFFLCVMAEGKNFDLAGTRAFLDDTGAEAVYVMEHGDE